jgi:hypothetical protein
METDGEDLTGSMALAESIIKRKNLVTVLVSFYKS